MKISFCFLLNSSIWKQKTIILSILISSPLANTLGNSLPTQVRIGVEGEIGMKNSIPPLSALQRKFKIHCLGEEKKHEHDCVVYRAGQLFR